MKTPPTILASFVKEMRRKHHLTQTDLADKSGVGLNFVRNLEQGELTLCIDKINQVLALFNAECGPVRQRKKLQTDNFDMTVDEAKRFILDRIDYFQLDAAIRKKITRMDPSSLPYNQFKVNQKNLLACYFAACELGIPIKSFSYSVMTDTIAALTRRRYYNIQGEDKVFPNYLEVILGMMCAGFDYKLYSSYPNEFLFNASPSRQRKLLDSYPAPRNNI